MQSCRFLLGSLVALLICFPFLEYAARPLFRILPIAWIFVAGVAAVDPGRVYVRSATVLAGIQVGLTLLSSLLQDRPAAYFAGLVLVVAAMAALIIIAIYAVLRYVLSARVITPEQIYAGLCVYLMLGFAFGAVFYLLNMLDPKSFSVNAGTVQPGGGVDLLYFSFITLATLGYGDITPGSRIARSLSELEALSGTLYMAVFMARLVSMHASSRDTS